MFMTRWLPAVHLRAARYDGQLSSGLPTVAHALVGKCERRLVDQNTASWKQIACWSALLDPTLRESHRAIE